jgi:hypothetical protein
MMDIDRNSGLLAPNSRPKKYETLLGKDCFKRDRQAAEEVGGAQWFSFGATCCVPAHHHPCAIVPNGNHVLKPLSRQDWFGSLLVSGK